MLRNIKKKQLEILLHVKDYLNKTENVESQSYENVLKNCAVPSETYQTSLSQSSSKPTIYLKRNPESIMINNYSPSLLLAWKANLDVQFVANPYGCINYVVNYINKEERETGTLLHAVTKKHKSQGLKTQMKKMW